MEQRIHIAVRNFDVQSMHPLDAPIRAVLKCFQIENFNSAPSTLHPIYALDPSWVAPRQVCDLICGDLYALCVTNIQFNDPSIFPLSIQIASPGLDIPRICIDIS